LGALSGGQRQLVFLAQALASNPRVLLLDEPFSALDIRHQLEVADLLARLTRERQLTTIIVLHDIPMAARLADQVALLKGGKLVRHGLVGDVIASSAMDEAFQIKLITERLESNRVDVLRIDLPARE
nr:ABC transporter ATP-binding protein [Beijerinckiaceae bacterium]